jgi:transposase
MQQQSKKLAAMKNFALILEIMKQQTSAAIETLNKGRAIINFSGKTIFVGVDIHKKDWQVALFHEGITLENFRVLAGSERLITHLTKRYPGASFRCVYESCAWGFTLQRQLAAVGIDCIVVHAGDVPGSNKEKVNKTDKVDALRLARHHAAGLLQGIHVPDEQLQKERNVIRYKKRLTGDLTRCRNRLKSLFKYQGIDIPEQLDKSKWSRNFIKWIEEEAEKDEIQKDVILLMLEEVKQLRQLLLKTMKKLRALMLTERYSQNLEILVSTVGVGPTTGMLFLMEIGDIRRFRTFDQLNNFVGFYPGSNSSGEKEQDTGISKRKHKELRTALVESAWQAIRIDPALMDAYKQLCKRMKANEAIIRIARKLLRRMRAVLIKKQKYEKGVIS